MEGNTGRKRGREIGDGNKNDMYVEVYVRECMYVCVCAMPSECMSLTVSFSPLVTRSCFSSVRMASSTLLGLVRRLFECKILMQW
jgi:hypothetical protein